MSKAIQQHLRAGKDISKKNFIRPEIPAQYSNNEKDLVLCNYQIHLSEKHDGYMNKNIVHLFGCTQSGNSILLNIHGFMTHFYIRLPSRWNSDDISLFISKVIEDCRGFDKVHHTIERKSSSYGFDDGKIRTFLKLSFINSVTRNVVKKFFLTEQFNYPELGLTNYIFTLSQHAANWNTQFLEGANINASSWITIPGRKYRIINDQNTGVQLDVNVSYGFLQPYECSIIPPLVMASLDIECIRGADDKRFPDENAEGDIIIVIVTTTQIYGRDDYYKVAHTVNTCLPIDGVDIECYETEREMLNGWRTFWKNLDADVFVGYNIFRFDCSYMFTRSKVTGLESFKYLGRIFDKETSIQAAQLSSKAFATNKWKLVPMYGVIQIDLLYYVKRLQKKLRTYTLNAVSKIYLGDEKEDLDYKLIKPYFLKDDEHRTIIVKYCIKDTLLPLQLLSCGKIKAIERLFSMSVITRSLVDVQIQRGQGALSESQLSWAFHQAGMIFCQNPNYEKEKRKQAQSSRQSGVGGPQETEEPKKYGGGYVEKPIYGFYEDPIPTLDFASLYPSIMIAAGLCTSTLVLKDKYKNIPGVNYKTITLTDRKTNEPIRDIVFAQNYSPSSPRHSEEIGIIPRVLKNLLAQRKIEKRLSAEAKERGDDDEFQRRESNQLNCKLSGNSIYGFCGASFSRYSCVEISASVTEIGKGMIIQVGDYVRKTYPGSTIIYGDTDSVMVNFNLKGEDSFRRTFEVAEEAAAGATKLFDPPHLLEFEKIYYPYYLYDTKKTYAGMLWTKPDKPDYMDVKGLKVVRREPCPLVTKTSQKVLECLMKIDIEGALKIIYDTLQDVIHNRVPFEDYLLCDGLSKPVEDYKSKTPPAHVALAKILHERDPNNAPGSGDRILYFIKNIPGVNTRNYKKCQLVESPDLMTKSNINRVWYIEHQLQVPMVKLMGLNTDCTKFFTDAIGELEKKNMGIMSIDSFFKRQPISNEEKKEKMVNQMMSRPTPPPKRQKTAPKFAKIDLSLFRK